MARRYWPAVGGVESFVRCLAQELGSRHEVTVLAQRIDNGPANRLTDSLSPPPRFDAFRDGPVLVRPLLIPPARRLLLFPLITQVLPGFRRYAYGRARLPAAALYALVVAPLIAKASRSADALHMWGGDLLAAACARAARLAGVPQVVTPFAHPNRWGDDPASARAYRSADRVVGLLEADAQIYRHVGVSPQRIEICGVCSPGMPSGGGGAIRQRYEIQGPLVLYLGVRRSYKGFDLLLEAAPRIAVRRPDVTFAFLGDGAALTLPTSAARILDVGSVDDVERAAWLDAADVLCLPSATEIFPVSILEAWSLGKPVITSDIPPLRELMSKSGGGSTVPRQAEALANALLELLADRGRMRYLGDAGRTFWIQHATVKEIAARHEHLYSRLQTETAPRAGVFPVRNQA